MNHPLPVGSYVLSIRGEEDADDFNRERQTGPYAIGRIVHVDDYSGNGQGWSYSVVFANGTWVHIDQRDSIDDAAKYRVFQAHELPELFVAREARDELREVVELLNDGIVDQLARDESAYGFTIDDEQHPWGDDIRHLDRVLAKWPRGK